MSTLERLQKLLERDFQLAPSALVAEATLESMDIDSLRMIEILFSIEDEFKIAIPAEQAQIRERVKTLGDLAAYIDEIVATPPGKAPA
jgi:acyl carrier protein